MQAATEIERSSRRAASACDVTIVAHDIGPVGGMERAIAELVMGLRDLGHHVTVIARACGLSRPQGVTFHRIRGPARPVLLAYPWFMLAGSLAVLRHRRGVVQTTGAIVLNRVDVISVHFCHQVGPANPSRPTRLFRAHAKAVRVVKLLGERLCFRANRMAAFVCVSDGVADELRHHYPELAERVLTIHNGVDTDAFAPGVRRAEAADLRTSLGIAEDRLVAAFVGSEWEGKGLRPLIEALALEPRWELVVAGRGDRPRYQELASSLGVGEAIHWLGVVSDVQLVYGLADAFVFPSVYETFSLVTFEAAASGLPILAPPVSGVRELIEDGRSGLQIDQQPATIAARLGELAADPELRARLGRAARESALGFSWQTMVERHDQLFAQLAPERRRA